MKKNDKNCDCEKKTERSAEQIRNLKVRLNRIEGQVRGIKNMIDRGEYCADIMIQTAAVTAAMNSFNKELLAEHIQNCVVKDIQEGNTEKVEELADLIRRVIR